MSDAETPVTPPPQDSPRGNGLRWLAGAAIAAVLIAGGYMALKNPPSSRSADAVEVAQTDIASQVVQPESQLSPGVSPVLAAENETTDAPVRRRAAKPPAPVPEEVIGITPSSITTGGADEIVVAASRRPVWTRTPSARRLSALYPERALERGREGEASVRCTVLETGALDCVRVSETPAHSGFGMAALRVASRFRHAPERADGSAAAGTPVNLRVVFRIDDDKRRRG